MRSKTNKALGVDLSIPLEWDVSDDTCFGREWDPRDLECRICGSYHVCANLFHFHVRKLEDDFKKKTGGFLDETNFNRIDMDKLSKMIKESPGEYSDKDVIEVFRVKSKCIDPETVEMAYKVFKFKYQLDDFIRPSK